MSKSKEELDALKEEINKINEKICELTPEELEQVATLRTPTYSTFCLKSNIEGEYENVKNK